MDFSDATVRHLYVELARLDILIHRRLGAMEQLLQGADRRAADAEAAGDEAPDMRPAAQPLALGRALHMGFDEAYRTLQQPFGETRTAETRTAETHSAQAGETKGSALEAEDENDEYVGALALLEKQIAALVQQADHEGDSSRLVQLAAACDLTRFELDAILICLAPALDLRYERLYGFLHDDLTRRRATVSLILELLTPTGPGRLAALSRFGDGMTLFRDRLVEPVAEPGILHPVLLNTALAPDPSLVTWLLGDYRPGPALADWVSWTPDPQAAQQRFLPSQMDALLAASDEDALLAMVGKDGAAQRAAVESFAALLGAPLLLLDAAAARRAGVEVDSLLRLFLRDARLTGAVAAIVGWQALLEEGAPPAPLFELLCDHPGPVVVGSDEAWLPHAATRERRLRWISFPAPEFAQRRAYLAHLIDALPPESTGAELSSAELSGGEPLDVTGVAGRFVLTTGQMNDLVASALDAAAQAVRPLSSDDLFAAARSHSSPRLSALARKLSLRYEWADLVLPDDQITRLHELVQMVQGRAQVLDEWGLARKLAPSYGVTALFAGAPGTGKTMAAEVMARALGLDVYKIDLSSMVSKYIGETEKNLEKLFAEAENSNAILFFDEADAIFGKRSEVKDAHDRYANIETSYLLQRMEAYDGVTILATNLRANLDEAFTRRLHGVIDFPFPDMAQRLRIWKALFPAGVPAAPDIDLETMARRFKFAGGSIRNVLVAASYFAAAEQAPLGMTHLLHATRREMQKLGRLADEREFAPAPSS